MYHIPISYRYYIFPAPPFQIRPDSQFEQPLNTRPTNLSVHQAHQTELFTLGAKCNRRNISNPIAWDRTWAACVTGHQFTVTIKSWLVSYTYHYYIHVTCRGALQRKNSEDFSAIIGIWLERSCITSARRF